MMSHPILSTHPIIVLEAPINNPQAIRLIETDSVIDGGILPSDATPGTEAPPPASHQYQGVAVLEEGVEEDGKWIHGASPFYSSLVKKIIVGQGYSLEPPAYPVVSLCSDNDKPITQTYCLPPNPYILGRLEQYRQQVIEDTSSKPANKAFPRPPISLERVAELMTMYLRSKSPHPCHVPSGRCLSLLTFGTIF